MEKFMVFVGIYMTRPKISSVALKKYIPSR